MPMAFASSARAQQRDQQPPPSSSSPAAAAPKRTMMDKALLVSGGAAAKTTETAAGAGGAAGFGLASAWGVVSVVYILVNAVKRLAPIAVQPFSRVRLRRYIWSMCGRSRVGEGGVCARGC